MQMCATMPHVLLRSLVSGTVQLHSCAHSRHWVRLLPPTPLMMMTWLDCGT